MKNFVTAIIVAAGESSRMGLGISKQFIPLLGEPVLKHTITAFEKSYIIDSIVVVCRPQDKIAISAIIKENSFKKVDAIVCGGNSRGQSVSNGIAGADPNTTHFAIHDGARPLISVEDIESVVKGAFKAKATTLGTFVTDTIKVIDQENYIVSTPVRSKLRAVQTPQVFEKELYMKALKSAEEKGLDFTDDCQLVENIGERVKVIIGSEDNIKLTTQNDIAIAENILKGRCN
jgi:2-C-methyl-D-erythritol 4-phosphate cytidylyltransferase